MFKFLKRIKFIIKIKKFFPFMKDFFFSKEVQTHKKLIGVGLIAAYFLFPFDLIPDFLSFFGIVDDIIIATFILERMIKIAPQSLKDKYHLLDK